MFVVVMAQVLVVSVCVGVLFYDCDVLPYNLLQSHQVCNVCVNPGSGVSAAKTPRHYSDLSELSIHAEEERA